jgi:hypothetical protein
MNSTLPASIDHPMAWRGNDIKGKDDVAFDLTPRHAAALEALLGRFRKEGRGLGDILPQHCRHPALDADLGGVFDAIQDGRGIVVIRGIPTAGHTDDEVGLMFWASARISAAACRRARAATCWVWCATRRRPGSRRAPAAIPAGASYRCMSISGRSSG